MPGIYETLYQKSPYDLDIFRSPAERKSWYEMSSLEQMRELRGKQQKLAELPYVPERRKNLKLRNAYKPVLGVLEAVGSILNIPGAMISGAVRQLVDESPGFSAQEYFRSVFTLKDQVSWRDVIGLLAERDEDQNIWDRKFVKIVGGLILDIALDPLTYFFGVGAYGKLVKSGKYVDEIGTMAQNMPKLIKGVTKALERVPEANHIWKNIYNSVFKVRGAKLPFAKVVKQPLQFKRAKAIRETLETGIREVKRVEKVYPMFQKTIKAQEKIGEIAKRIKPLAEIPSAPQRISNALRRFMPGYAWIERAFAPMTNARRHIITEKLSMMHKLGHSVKAVEGEILQSIKGLDYKGLRLISEICEDLPYIDDQLVKSIKEISILNGKIIRQFMRGENWQATMARLVGKNEEYGNWVTDGLKKIMSHYDNQKWAVKQGFLKKAIRKPTGQQLFKQIDYMMDEILSRQFMRMMDKANMKVGDLTSIAKWKPKKDIRHIFDTLGKDISMEQKQKLSGLLETSRHSLNWAWDDEYIKGIPSNYIDDYMQRTTAIKTIGMPKEFGSRPRFTLHRFDEMTVTQKFDDAVETLMNTGQARTKAHARKLLREGRAEGYPRMVDTISEAWYNRMVAHYKAVYKKEFLDKMPEYGLHVGRNVAAPDTMARVLGTKDQVLDELAEYVFNIKDARYINRALNVISDDRAINQFMGFIDKTQSWWKQLVTTVNPGFHFRNMYSNHFLGWIRHGLKYFSPKVHQDGMALTLQVLYPDKKAIWKAFRISPARLDESVYAGKTLRELADEIVEYGVVRTGVRRAEQPVLRGVRGARGAGKFLRRMNIAGRDSIMAKVGGDVGGIIESQARGTSFLLEMDVFGSTRLAARKTQEVFVDYTNITEFERLIARPVFPFWSWMKQNTANQVKFIFSQPGRYGKIARVAQAVEAGAEKIPEKEKPDWFRELWMWQMPITMPDGTALFFNPNFPFQDLLKLDPTQFKRTLLTAMTPFVKVPIELATGYEFFRKAPLERYPGYKALVPGILQDIVKVFPSDVKKILKIEKDKEGRYRMNPKTAHAITNLLPFVRNTSRLLMREPTRIPSDRYFQWLSYTLGIKLKPVDRLTQQYYSTLDAIQERKKKLKELEVVY